MCSFRAFVASRKRNRTDFSALYFFVVVIVVALTFFSPSF